MSENRYAVINHGVSGTRNGVAAYLPANYAVLGGDNDVTLIGGYDDAGWTLDDYVLPRLASGLYFGQELDPVPGWLRGTFDPQIAARTRERVA